jgi:hypothetical protein
MLCSVVVGYKCFRGPCCLHLQGEDRGTTLHSVKPRRSQLETSVWSVSVQNQHVLIITEDFISIVAPTDCKDYCAF